MKSPLKKIVVYDLETGGLKSTFNSITEIALVAIDLESLVIEGEYSVMIQPYIDTESILRHDLKREAKLIFSELAEKDPDTNIKSLYYKGGFRTLKNLDIILEDLDKLHHTKDIWKDKIWDWNYIQKLTKTDLKEIVELLVKKTYNPQALAVTHISMDDLINEGVPYQDAFKFIKDTLSKYKVGNNLPILAGHNIKKFDMPFLHNFFFLNNSNLDKFINTFLMDTLEMARLRWAEMPSYSLGVCANELGLTLKEAHRALPDTIANAKFLIKLLKSLRGEGSQQSKGYVRRKFNMQF